MAKDSAGEVGYCERVPESGHGTRRNMVIKDSYTFFDSPCTDKGDFYASTVL
jgi:hypothetical protein